jgi:hypothetical protein
MTAMIMIAKARTTWLSLVKPNVPSVQLPLGGLNI